MSLRIRSIGLVITMAALSSAASELTVSGKMPELRGDYLSGRKASLPEDASGRVALLLFGFTYQSRFAVEDWIKRFRGDFGKNPDITFYEIPMIGGFARMGKWFIDGGMRRGTPKADHENVITVYGGTQLWKQRLGFKAEDSAYLVVVDRTGKIALRHAGPFDEASYQALAAHVRELVSTE